MSHSHDPNPILPSVDPSFVLVLTGGPLRLTPVDLSRLPLRSVGDCLIVSTGHGTSGPFTFGGAALIDLLDHYVNEAWAFVDVVSADGFSARLSAEELRAATARPILLATEIDGRPLGRDEGLVRLIVPGEDDDALRQVKWVGEIRLQQ